MMSTDFPPLGPSTIRISATQMLSDALVAKEGWTPIKRGAEASLWKITLFGTPCVAKVTEPKLWRAQQLDERLRAERIQNEARTNLKCLRLGIPIAPIVYIDVPSSTFVMKELEGPTVKQLLFDTTDPSDSRAIQAMREMGSIVARLHENEIIHSDLTTSNFMLHHGTVHVIDFGLSYVSSMDEDKAVDLYVMERAFASSHPGLEPLLEIAMQAYIEGSPRAEQTLKRLKKVRARGRKRSMVG